MHTLRRNIPNIITIFRILGAIAIIFLEPFSLPFFIVYGICGMSDFIDGYLARKLDVSSHLGSILDSVGDLIFLGVMGAKVIPYLINVYHLALWNWIIILIPFVLQMSAYVICAFKFKKFSAVHTYMNKVLSASIFFYPFTFIGDVRLIYEIYAIVFGTSAIYASIEINLIHILAREYDEKNKTIFHVLKKLRNQ